MSRAAIRYAKAVLEAAHDKGAAGEVNNDMLSIASTIGGNAELKEFLVSPTTTSDAKENALLEIFSGINELTKKLFTLLHNNKRFEILGAVASEYNRLFEEMNGVEIATVTTAIAMDQEIEAKVLSKILEFSNKKVVIDNKIDESIIGGFILRIGDKQYNASVASRLQTLKRELMN